MRRTRIYMVFHHSVLLPNKLVIENVELGLKLRGIALAERRRAEEMLSRPIEDGGRRLITLSRQPGPALPPSGEMGRTGRLSMPSTRDGFCQKCETYAA